MKQSHIETHKARLAEFKQAQQDQEALRRQQAEAALAAEQQARQRMDQMLGSLLQDMQGASAGQSSLSQLSLDFAEPTDARAFEGILAEEPATQQDEGLLQSPAGPMQSPPGRTGTLPGPEQAASGSTRSSRGDSRDPGVGAHDGPLSQQRGSPTRSPHSSAGKENRADNTPGRSQLQAPDSQTPSLHKQQTPSCVEA